MKTQAEIRNVLIRTRELVQQGWCQRDVAQDTTEKAVFSRDPSACRWCLVGALKRAKWENNGQIGLAYREDPIYQAIQSQLLPTHKSPWLSEYNDLPTTTQQDVLAVLDRTIAQAKCGQDNNE